MKFILKGNPQSTNNIYRHAGHRVYMTKAGHDLKEDYQWQLKNQYKGKIIKENINMTLDLFFGDKRVRDIDNYNKILLDSFKNIVWDDDSQIQKLTISKNYCKTVPRVEIDIEIIL